MPPRKAIHIFNGPGAGNIGDELMLHGLDSQLPADFALHMFLHENHTGQRQPYPARFHAETLQLPPPTFELDHAGEHPGLLAGATVITDSEGWGWPLSFLAPRIQHFSDHGLPVDAVGIGADFLVTPEGRKLFTDHFLTVRSWTVRDAAGREGLIDAGVAPERVAVGADWAWLFQSPCDYGPWAAEYLTSLGIRLGEPLLIVNVFWQGQGLSLPIWNDIAAALDQLHERDGLQIAFFCNEVRHPGFDRTAVETIQSFMQQPSTLIPNLYFAPGEAIAILRHATATLGQRYHYCVQSVLAETVPVNLGRSPKISGLCLELGLRPCGSLTEMDREEIAAAVREAIAARPTLIPTLQDRRHALAARALHNLDFFRAYYDYPAVP